MSYRFEVDSSNGILCCGIEGHVSDNVMKEFYDMTATHTAELCPQRLVFDFSDVTSFEVSSPVVRELASRAPVRTAPSRVRIVVAPTYQLSCLAQMFQSDARPISQIVRRLPEAWAAIGVHKPHFEPLPVQSEDPASRPARMGTLTFSFSRLRTLARGYSPQSIAGRFAGRLAQGARRTAHARPRRATERYASENEALPNPAPVAEDVFEAARRRFFEVTPPASAPAPALVKTSN